MAQTTESPSASAPPTTTTNSSSNINEIIPFAQRPQKNTIVLFDVDGTLTPARNPISPAMTALLAQLRRKCVIGFVGGSDLVKQQEQLSAGKTGAPVSSLFDFCFAENGLTAIRLGEELASTSFIEWMGEARYKEFVNWVLADLARVECPVKRGTFVEFRNGMVNVSPVGRNASDAERRAFEDFDRVHKVRERMIGRMKERFAGLELKYSIGGMISFDVFPVGWDKTYCLRHLEAEKERSGLVFEEVHFFGDKTFPGGNDFEIYQDPRTIGHAVKNPEETMAEIKRLFDL